MTPTRETSGKLTEELEQIVNLFAQNPHFEAFFGLAERYSGKSGIEKSEKEAYDRYKMAWGGHAPVHMGNLGL